MKINKRVVLAVTGCTMCGMLAAGCTAKKQVQSANGENELSYWVAMPAQAAATMSSLSEVEAYKVLEEKTGVKINFIHPATGQAAEKFNLLIASKEYPDIIEANWKKMYNGGAGKAYSDGVLVAIDDYIDCVPNFKQFLEDAPETRRGMKTTDGKYVLFAQASREVAATQYGGMMLRKDWLDKVGMEVPETIDEWDKVLHAFKEQLGVESPLLIQSGWFKVDGNGNNFNNAYGVDLGWYLDKDTVKFGPAEPGYKKYIELMHKWYEEGILNKEFDIISGNSFASSVLEGKTGAFYGFIGGNMGSYLTAMEERGDKEFDLVGAQVPVLNKGDEAYFMSSVSLVGGTGAGVTTSCKNPELAMSWLDNLFSDEGSMLMYYGVEGKTYTMDENRNVTYTDYVLDNEDGLDPTTVLAKYTRAYTDAPGCNPKDVYLTNSKYDKPSMQAAFETYNKYAENRLSTYLPQMEYPLEVVDEVSSIEFNINTYVFETVIQFIKGSEPMENFDQFVSNLKSMNLDRLTEIKQQAYNDYIKE